MCNSVTFYILLEESNLSIHLSNLSKAYKTSEKKGFFPLEWFESPNKLDALFLSAYEYFFNKLRDHRPLAEDFTDFTKLLNSGLSHQEALKCLRPKKVLPSGDDNHNYPKVVWEKEQMSITKDFVNRYSNKDVVPTLKAMQK